jgi:transcriptional regulator with XRE-family HTH domain
MSDQLRDLVRRDGRGVRELAARAGVDPSQVSRFMNGKTTGGTTMDALGLLLGVRLDADAPRRTTKGDR